MLATQPVLFDLTAADLMSRDVLMIPQEMSLRTAAHTLSQARVHGAPVVDERMRCIGVISATDFLKWAETGVPGTLVYSQAPGPVCDWEVVNLDVLPADEVGAHMTRDPVTAGAETPIRDLARMMLDAQIHRVVVTDEDRRPVGIVSSTDILAAVARAREE